MGVGVPTTLDVLQQWTIARWTLVKAMVWEHISSAKTIFYTDEDRTGLRAGTIPPNTLVWLGGHVGRETFFSTGADANSQPGVVPRLEAYFSTFAYRRLVIQVMTVRPYEYPDPYTLINCNQRVFGDAVIRIWPTEHKAFWPPALILDDGMLELFHRRCDGTELRMEISTDKG